MYEVVIEKQALKQLATIPSPDNTRILQAIKELATNPRPNGYKKLRGRRGYRIRIGNYRAIYHINDRILTVYILVVGNRRDVYE